MGSARGRGDDSNCFFCSCVILEMLEIEEVPRILGQYDR
jgi:hypothetical protein